MRELAAIVVATLMLVVLVPLLIVYCLSGWIIWRGCDAGERLLARGAA